MTTKNRQTCLSAEMLRQLSHDELSPTELEDIEEHVSGCDRCRNLLEVSQSDPQWREEIVPILRTPFESPRAAGDHDDGGSDESLESILRMLGPTDDPHMLGRIGSYDVVGVIGRGGMGVVFKAYEGALNRFVAIKMLLPHLAASGAARKRFAREGQAAAAVIDDNVMPIYSVAEWQGLPYLVTQYSRGETLQKRIQDQGPLELKEILRIGMQTARGLTAAHAQGLVHRDVKPSNILLDGTVERALLTDFGLARAVDDASITRTGTIAGTPQYMSPEQARGGSVDARSDLFGLGCVLYAMCTGRPPFRADSSYAILRMITDDEPRSIREVNPDIPEWLCLLISRLMAKSPDVRFGGALQVADLLEQCLAHVQQPTSVPLPVSLVPHATGRRSIFNLTRKRVIAMLGTIGMTLLGMVLWQATEAPDISGQWTSDEWGTVVLEAKQPGQYDGTFTGSGNDKPTPTNDPPGGGPGDGSNGFGNKPMSGPGVLIRSSGTLHLKWSRVERRFNGTWGKGADRSGTMSLRLVDKDIRGGWTTDEGAQKQSGTPRLADLVWARDASKKQPAESRSTTTINPEVPANGRPVNKDTLLKELRERDRQFSRRSIEMERTWDTAISPRGQAQQERYNSIRLGAGDPGEPEGLPDFYQQPHRIRYIWTGQDFDSTLEILADLETAIHPKHGKLESRTIESDCFSYHRIWDRDQEIFSYSSDIARLNSGKKAWEYLLPSGVGFTPSILNVSNAVEVDDGYVLKGLISLPSATIGNRRNCYELHFDKELILRRAVIQYHVYDFVIVTSGRSEFAGMPPLAKLAAVSIHYIGQDEKRSGDVGNYKYEVVALSERLSKADYDLRVNFAIPKGTKLAAGLNLVEANLQGLPGVTQVERDQTPPRPQMTPRDLGQNTGDARSVIEAYVSAALSGRVDQAASFAKGTPAVRDQIEAFSRQLNVQRLAMKSVYVNDPAKPVSALVTSEAVKLTKKQPDGQRDGFLLLTLTMSDEGWFVTDIDLESEESADSKLKKFLETNPDAIILPPLTGNSLPHRNPVGTAKVSGTDNDSDPRVPDENGIYWSDQNEDNWVTGMKVVQWPTAVNRKLVVEFLLRNDSPETREIDVSLFCSNKMSLSLSGGNKARVDIPQTESREKRSAAPNGVLQFKEGRAEISFASLESGEYTLRFGPYIFMRRGVGNSGSGVPFDLSLPVTFDAAYDGLPIHWGEPVAGLRLGAMFLDAQKDQVKRFKGNDKVVVQLFVQNVSQREVDCRFNLPLPIDGWKLHIADSAGQQIKGVRGPVDTGVDIQPPPFHSILAPGKIVSISGEPQREHAQFTIVPEKPLPLRPGQPVDYVLPAGEYTARLSASFRKADSPDVTFVMETALCPFRVDATQGTAKVPRDAQPDWAVAWDFRYTLLNQRYAMMRISSDGKMEAHFPGGRLLRTQLSPDELSALVALVAKNENVQSRPITKAVEYSEAVTPKPELVDSINKVNVRSEIVAVVHKGELLELDLDTRESADVTNQLWKLVGLAAIGGSEELPQLLDVANTELKRKYPDVSNEIDQTHFRFAIVDHPSGNISVWFNFNIDPGSNDGKVVLRIPEDGQPSIAQVVVPKEESPPDAAEKPTATATPKLPKLPDEAYTTGIHCQKFREEDAKRPGGELMGDVMESERGEDPLVLGMRVASDATWNIGGQARVELVVRNVSGSDVKFTQVLRADNGLSVVAIDKDGKEHQAEIAQFDSWLVLNHLLLPRSHVVMVKSFTLRFDPEKRDAYEPDVAAFYLPPGDYALRCTWNDARPEVAHEGEWTGELVSVEHKFTLTAAPAVSEE